MFIRGGGQFVQNPKRPIDPPWGRGEQKKKKQPKQALGQERGELGENQVVSKKKNWTQTMGNWSPPIFLLLNPGN